MAKNKRDPKSEQFRRMVMAIVAYSAIGILILTGCFLIAMMGINTMLLPHWDKIVRELQDFAVFSLAVLGVIGTGYYIAWNDQRIARLKQIVESEESKDG